MRRSTARGIIRLMIAIVVIASILAVGGCKRPSERRKEQARLDSLRNDTARPSINPYKMGEGTAQYDRERENLGNLDSLVTPPQPVVPRTPRP